MQAQATQSVTSSSSREEGSSQSPSAYLPGRDLAERGLAELAAAAIGRLLRPGGPLKPIRVLRRTGGGGRSRPARLCRTPPTSSSTRGLKAMSISRTASVKPKGFACMISLALRAAEDEHASKLAGEMKVHSDECEKGARKERCGIVTGEVVTPLRDSICESEEKTEVVEKAVVCSTRLHLARVGWRGKGLWRPKSGVRRERKRRGNCSNVHGKAKRLAQIIFASL